jgi:hypothetical protein
MKVQKFDTVILYEDDSIKSMSEKEFKETCEKLGGIFEKNDEVLICRGNLIQYEIKCDTSRGICLQKIDFKNIVELV